MVDENDKIISPVNKLDAHSVHEIQNLKSKLHRAFSIFIFNSLDKTLLLTKRSHLKLCFPGIWTNSVCSHPLYTDRHMSMHHKYAVLDRLSFELNCPVTDQSRYLKSTQIYTPSSQSGGQVRHINPSTVGKVTPDDLMKSLRFSQSASQDGVLCESELDWCWIIDVADIQENGELIEKITHGQNKHEHDEVRWVTKKELDELYEQHLRNQDVEYTALRDGDSEVVKMSPWFAELQKYKQIDTFQGLVCGNEPRRAEFVEDMWKKIERFKREV